MNLDLSHRLKYSFCGKGQDFVTVKSYGVKKARGEQSFADQIHCIFKQSSIGQKIRTIYDQIEMSFFGLRDSSPETSSNLKSE